MMEIQSVTHLEEARTVAHLKASAEHAAGISFAGGALPGKFDHTCGKLITLLMPQ